MRKPPKLCHHKGRELGYVTVAGREEYFTGHWPRDQDQPSKAIEQQYLAWLRRWTVERAAAPEASQVGQDCTLAELWLAYFERCRKKYVKHGKPTSEQDNVRRAVAVAVRLYGQEPAGEFTPKKLKAVRAAYVEAGWCLGSVNRAADRLRGMFRWAVEEELVAETVYRALCAVSPLPRGAAPERPPVRPVSWDHVQAVLPLLSPSLSALVRVHWLLGCRAQDVTIMRPCDLDRSADLWLYTPTHAPTNEPTSKVEHHGGPPLCYWVGPQAQAVLSPLLEAVEPDGWLFPSRYHEPYTTRGYGFQVKKACRKLGISVWTPLQVRHARLTEIRAGNWGGRSGAEAAQVVARHKSLRTTEVYAERDEALAREVMRRLG